MFIVFQFISVELHLTTETRNKISSASVVWREASARGQQQLFPGMFWIRDHFFKYLNTVFFLVDSETNFNTLFIILYDASRSWPCPDLSFGSFPLLL